MDTHPPKMEFEIDRDGLRRSLISEYLLLMALFAGFLMFIGLMIALGRAGNLGIASGVTFLACWITGLIALFSWRYFVFTRKTLGHGLDSISLKVDGPYLLVQTYDVLNGSWHDRKLHFKSIVDYGIHENSKMRRFGIQALKLTTLAGGASSDVIVPAVRNCRQVRDLLSEIDHARENS
jgi:hypothetical protein